MKMKKVLSLAIMLVIAGSLLVGCGKENSAKDTVNSNESSITPVKTAEMEEKTEVELTFYNGETEDPWTDPVALAITEATGVKLNVKNGISADGQQIALMIAEQNYPDLIFTKDQASSLVEAGALMDLSDLINQYGPNIKKMYGDELKKLRFSKEDPSIFMLSAYGVGGNIYKTSGTVQVQWDVLKENNYQIPYTLEAYESMIKNYMAAHPNTEDGLKTIGLSLSTTDWRWMITLGNPAGFIMTGELGNGQWSIDKDYNCVFRFRKDVEKEYFRWLNKMYNEGVLDSEFATQTHEDYIAKIASGRVLSLMDADWDYSDGEKVLKADGKLGKTYSGLPVTKDESVKCSTLAYSGLVTGQGVGISSTCKDPIAAIKFLDYLCSDEGQVLTHWGIKDVNYFIDEEGHRYRTEEEVNKANTDTEYSRTTGVGFHIYPFPTYGDGVVDSSGSTYSTVSKDAIIAEYNEEQKAACKAWGVELLVEVFPQALEFEVPDYSPIWAYAKPTVFNEISTILDEISWAGLIKAVIGKETDFDSNYDVMLKDLEAAGMYEAEKMLSDIVKEKVALVVE